MVYGNIICPLGVIGLSYNKAILNNHNPAANGFERLTGKFDG